MMTQKQMAAQLGLSQATVAQALSGRGKLREATRQRVLCYAEEVGYIVDHAAVSLVGRRHAQTKGGFNIAWITADPDSKLDDPIVWYARRALDHYGYGFEFLPLGQIQPLDRLPRILNARGVGGLVIATQGVRGAYPEHPVWQEISVPTVAVYLGSPHLPFHRVSSDAFREGEQATRIAIERGYRRIGMVLSTTRDTQETQRLRLGGYLTAHQMANLPLPPHFLLKVDQPIPGETSLDLLQAWHREQALDCCLFADAASWDSISIHRRSLESVFCGMSAISLFVIKSQREWFAGYLNPAGSVAWTAVRMIDSYIRHPVEYEKVSKHPNTVLVQGHWNEGASLPWVG